MTGVDPKGKSWRDIPVDDETLSYVIQYGGRCRECADNFGICSTGLPCQPNEARAAIRHVLRAINYGMSHGYLAALTPLKGAPDAREADPITELAAASRAADKDWEERSGIRYPGGFPSTLPATKGVTEAMAWCIAVCDHAIEHYKGPVAMKIRREIAVEMARLASLTLPAPGEGEPGLTSPEAIKSLIGMVRAEAASWREPECYEPRDAVEEAAFLDVIADTLEALSPTAPELPVKVKLLEWRKKSARNYYATTILGTYGAADALGTAAAGLTHILPPAWIDPAGAHHEVDSVETAKVAAQADFEARILSALVRRATHIDQPQTDDMQPDTYTGGDFNGVVRGKRP